jgi:hypothetical protein
LYRDRGQGQERQNAKGKRKKRKKEGRRKKEEGRRKKSQFGKDAGGLTGIAKPRTEGRKSKAED